MEMRPQVKIQVGGPITVYCDTAHTAHIVLTNPTSWDWTYYVAVAGAGGYWSDSWTVTVAAGGSVTHDILDTAPSTPMSLAYTAVVYLDDAAGDILFSEQIDTIDVVEEAVPDVDVTLTWD